MSEEVTAFDAVSYGKLKSVHKDLRKLFITVAELYPCAVICGHRGKISQNEAYDKGFSKKRYPESKHNSYPSEAIDVFPLPLDWHDTNRFYFFAGYVMAVADLLEISIRFGGDWNGNKQFNDNSFNDLVHFELTSVSV